MSPEPQHAIGRPRIGLLGNPSDLYGGAGLGFTFDDFAAHVHIEPAERLDLGDDDPATAPFAELLHAGWAAFRKHAMRLGEPTGHGMTRGPAAGSELCLDGATQPLAPFAVRASTDIPRQAGLSGSSAVLVALVRALAGWSGLDLPAHRVAEIAWRAEMDEMGILAGPLDRLVQAHEGLLAMDFAQPWHPASSTRLDPSALPPLLLAWFTEPGIASGSVHAPVFARWELGDKTVCAVVESWRPLVDEGRAALAAGRVADFGRCMDRNFDLRERIFPISEMDRRMVTVARSLGAWVKFCGSGGAVVCATTDTAARDELARALHDARFQTMPVTPGRVGTGSGSRAGTGTASSDAPGTSTASAPDAPASVPLCDGGLRAVVLAAGFATRLWPLTKDKAKPLLEVGGETMLDRLLRQLEATGAFQDVVVVTNDRFHQAFVDWRAGWTGLPVHVVNDGAPDNDSRLGAVADLALALDEAPPPARPVTGHCVAAGDNLLDESFVEHITHFATSGVPQLVVRRLPSPVPPGKYSEICFDDAQRITSFREKPADPRSNWSALAMYLLPPELPALVATYLSDPEAMRDAPGSFIAWLCEQGPVEARPLGGRWFDIGDRTQLDEARAWAADAD